MANLHKSSDVAVLFVLIGWAQRYDGTESIVGGHSYLKNNPDNNTEMEAFISDNKGYYCCGIDRGNVDEPSLDVVFVARNVKNDNYEVVGLYSNVKVTGKDRWRSVRTKQVLLIPSGERPIVPNYPTGQGMRRWAHRIVSKGTVHKSLLSVYKKLANLKNWDTTTLSPEELEISAFEGKRRKQFIIHRHREAKLRSAKIRDVLLKNAGVLQCEVPGCGFDFHHVYGTIGENFAIVHHRTPLAESSLSGRKTTINELAVVCSNCHAMIHRGGECRSLDSLIKSTKQSA
ncbi:MAG: HNH endonuclease [Desulfuromonadales bacterium]